jgi:hypothetical protein
MRSHIFTLRATTTLFSKPFAFKNIVPLAWAQTAFDTLRDGHLTTGTSQKRT